MKNQVEEIMKRPIKRKTNNRTANKVKGISVSEPDYMTPLIEPFDGVWSGQIARTPFLRITAMGSGVFGPWQ